MSLLEPQLTLGQKDYLINLIRNDENLKRHWNIEESRECLDNLGLSIYKYILRMWADNRYIKINEVLQQLGVKRRDPKTLISDKYF